MIFIILPTRIMRPLPLFILSLLLLLPLSANAKIMKATKPTPADHVKLHDTWNPGAHKPVSSASAESVVTVRNPSLGISFQTLSDWKTSTSEKGIALSLQRSMLPESSPSTIMIVRSSLPKDWTQKKAYISFLQKVMLNSSETGVLPDTYLPSFHLSASGSIKVQKMDALSLSYTGEVRSISMVFRYIMFTDSGFLYQIYSQSLPEYAIADSKVFDGVVKSLVIERQGGSSSSVGGGKRT